MSLNRLLIILGIIALMAYMGSKVQKEELEKELPQKESFLKFGELKTAEDSAKYKPLTDSLAIAMYQAAWDQTTLKYSSGFPQYKDYIDNLNEVLISMKTLVDFAPAKYPKLAKLHKELINSKKNSKAMRDRLTYGQPWGEGDLKVACEIYLNRVLNDPDSYELENFRVLGQTKDAWACEITYRARNGFGGLILENREFDVKYNFEKDNYYAVLVR